MATRATLVAFGLALSFHLTEVVRSESMDTPHCIGRHEVILAASPMYVATGGQSVEADVKFLSSMRADTAWAVHRVVAETLWCATA